MEILTKDKLSSLMEKTGQPLISLYLPTHRVGREVQQDPIRFKNLLSQAERRLADEGLRQPEINDNLKQAQDLLQDGEFWQHLSDGLALFFTEDFMEIFRLPISFEPLLVIADRFHLKPLLPLLSRNGHFFVLALSQKQVRLLEGSLFSIDEIDLESTPTSLREALAFDDPEKQLQFYTMATTPGGTGAHRVGFHGQGVSEDDTKSNLLRYFQKVDHGLMELLGEEQAPLVLAGVDYLQPIYRQANSYPHLISESIAGNPDQLSAEELHERAWNLIKPVFAEDQQAALARFQELHGSGSDLASTRIESILQAAQYGRLETLFVALGVQLWGSWDAENSTLELHKQFQPGDRDLLDYAAAQTLLNGGQVFALEMEQMPVEGPLAAVFRYAYED
jgi:hypothetical protein